jgi:transcriptional regulator GlxA family with amidase domain
MVVFPAFQALDVFGPLDALNMLSFNYAVNLSIIAPSLDPVSTRPGMVNAYGSNCSESVVPTHTFDDPPANLDVLIVPGGIGTRNNETLDMVAEFVKTTYPEVDYLISVCTGAAILAHAGVLDGKRATTNKKSWDWATSQGPNVDWVSHARWVSDGNIWTTSGVSAGIDGMLAFMSEVYGENATETVAVGMEYERETNSTDDPFADYYNLP